MKRDQVAVEKSGDFHAENGALCAVLMPSCPQECRRELVRLKKVVFPLSTLHKLCELFRRHCKGRS